MAYEAIRRDDSPSLPALLLQYSDFATWQRQLLSHDGGRSGIAFWQETLKGTSACSRLPCDHARPPLESFRGAKIFFVLPQSLTESLNAVSHREGVTPFVTLMAVFKVLLYRYTGQNDLIVGFPIANRSWGEAMDLIGFFVNTSVARTIISGQLVFREFLFRVRDVCQAAYHHHELPFEKLVEVLQPPRDSSRNPIFQAMLAFQNMPRGYAYLPNYAPPHSHRQRFIQS